MSVPAGSRERLVRAMEDLLQTRGYHAAGLNTLLEAAGAPKGVMYHHFPGGKVALAEDAIRGLKDRILARLDRLFATHRSPRAALAAWTEDALRRLEASSFERGCPLATVTLETTAEHAGLRAVLSETFDAMRERIARAFVEDGVPKRDADGLAALCISTYEGALLLARAGQDSAVIRSAMGALRRLLEAAAPVRPKRPAK